MTDGSATATANRSLTLNTATIQSGVTRTSIDHFAGVPNKIKDFFNNKKFCDITLISKDESYKVDAHKMILCTASEFFFIMFGGSMREANEDQVKLHIDGPSLKSVIKFIYTSSIELTSQTVKDILITADYLHLSDLKALCSDFMAKELYLSNCLGIALFAEKYNLELLQKTSESFVCDNFMKLCEEDEFFDLDVHQLSKFLSSNELQVDNEEFVFRSLMLWINKDKPNREKCMTELLHHIRFPLLTPKYIASVIEPACKNIECERLIYKAYKWHFLPEMRFQLFTEEQAQLRNMNGLIMGISGLHQNGGFLNVSFFNPSLNEWTYKIKILNLEIGRRDFGYTTFNGKLVIAGGYLNTTNELTDRVDCLDMRTFEWTSLAPMKTKRSHFGMASLKGFIYAVGGKDLNYSLNSIEKYDPSTKVWSFVALNLYIIQSSTKYVSATMNQFVVSSRDNTGYMSWAYWLYDPQTNQLTNKLFTGNEPIGTGTISYFGDSVFIAVSRDSINRYNFKTKAHTVKYNNLPFECNKCVFSGDVILAYGGNKLLKYNNLSEEWENCPAFENSEDSLLLV